MVHLFQYIEGVDDLVVWEEDVEQDDVRLRQVLDRAVVITTLSLTRRNAIFEHLKLIMWAMCWVSTMPTPANREDVQRFLGVVTQTCLRTSQKSAPLHQLLQKDVEWSWGQVEQDSYFNLLSSSPQVLWPEIKEPVTLAVDARWKGVRAVLLQNDRPVAYASKALTPSQEKYEQIEKEMLAIVFGCEWFHDYLYGQRKITAESDHKPLEAILKKPIHQASLRLQKMILILKPYTVNVKHIPGSHLVLADKLSRT